MITKQLEGTEPVEAKDRVNDYETWERQMTSAPDNFMHQPGSLTT